MKYEYKVLDNYTGELSSGEYVENETIYEVHNNYTGELELLTECDFDDEYVFCDRCGELTERDYAIWIQDEEMLVCEECCDNHYYYCEECDCYHDCENNPPVYFEDSDSFVCCEQMAYENHYQCEECDCFWRWNDDLTWNSRDECYYCEDCKPDSIINEYHGTDDYDKYRFMDNENRKKNLHIGFELEVHNANDYSDGEDEAFWIQDKFEDYVCFEEDSSITPGFEIITRPATLDVHLKYDWKSVFDFLVSKGYVSHNGGLCGLHTHIDRDYFGDSCIQRETAEAKFLWLFEKHWENLAKFSRRKDFYYCNKNPKTNGYRYDLKYCRSKHRGHYIAVNLENYNTIELRLWRGTLRYETFVATLKFVNRLAYLVKYTSVIQLNKMSWEEILGNDKDILAYWETVKNRI